MSDSNSESLENMIGNSIQLNNIDFSHDNNHKVFGLSDCNNIETADRKLIVNNKYEFWVHDYILCLNSKFFSKYFDENLDKNEKTTIVTTEEDEIKQTKIFIPYNELFFDILLWMYTKDYKKLKLFSKDYNTFLSLLSLGTYLQLINEFFDELLNNFNFNWKKENFDNILWSRTTINFPILIKIVNKINSDNYLKIYSLLSWLKVIDIEKKKIKKDDLTKKSNDLFFVRNYIKKKNLMKNLKTEELILLKNKFPEYKSALDIIGLLNNFYFSKINIKCIVCNKKFSSQFEAIENCICEGKKYHPICLFSKNDFCKHENCRKKYSKDEYMCCHKKIDNKNNGCLINEGKHIFIIENNEL